MGNDFRNNLLGLRDDACIALCEVSCNSVLDVMNRKAVAAPGRDGKCGLWKDVCLLIDQQLSRTLCLFT
jgi:hypothetical protein